MSGSPSLLDSDTGYFDELYTTTYSDNCDDTSATPLVTPAEGTAESKWVGFCSRPCVSTPITTTTTINTFVSAEEKLEVEVISRNGRNEEVCVDSAPTIFARKQEELPFSPSPSVSGHPTFLPFESFENLTEIEAIAVRLKGSVNFAEKFLFTTDTRDTIVYEVILAVRAVNKFTIELLTKGDGLDSEKNKLVLEAVFVVSELYLKFIETVDFNKSEENILNQLGIHLIVTGLGELLTHKYDDTGVSGHLRGNFAHEIIDRLKPMRIRKMILAEVIRVLQKILNRLCEVTSKAGKEKIINYSDIDSTFRLLQILEQIIVTTDNQPWMLNEDVRKLMQLETTFQITLPLLTVQVFLSRVVTLARKKEAIPSEIMDISISDESE